MKWYAILGVVVQSTIWVVVILVLCIWMYLSLSEYCCCCCCFRSRLHGPRPGAVAGAASAAASTRGLQSPEIDERYPKFIYPKVEGNTSVKMNREITECVVCLGAFMEGDTLRLISVCGHVFHADCVDVWLRSHTTCPCCRANLVPLLPETTNDLPV